MICFALICADDHAFDSWFASNAAYDALVGQMACPICGGRGLRKSLMAPNVRPANRAGSLSAPQNEIEAAAQAMRRSVTENSDYVGMNFAAEARAMHDGDIEARAIYGEAKLADARALLEDGVAVMPLPFMTKTN